MRRHGVTTRQRPPRWGASVGHLALAAIALAPACLPACASTAATPPPSTAAATLAPTRTVTSTSGARSSGTPTSGTPTSDTGPTSAPATTSPLPTVALPTAPATSATPSSTTTTMPRPPSLAPWTVPGVPYTVPGPTTGVGIAAVPELPGTVVLYPAVTGSGRGHPRYVDPALAIAAGLDPALTDRVQVAAEIDATPVAATRPRPIVLLTPGWRSLVALSTSLAEGLAAAGYVVVASQPDVAAEVRHRRPVPEDRDARLALAATVLDWLAGPGIDRIAGPVDRTRVAMGGHSYAGSVAFDLSLTDHRLTAVFDLDGSVRGTALTTPVTVPALLVVTVLDGTPSDRTLADLALRSASLVTVGVTGALHVDLTDGAAIAPVLAGSDFASQLGPIGATGTIEASAIVRRFLDAVLGDPPTAPDAARLAAGLPAVTLTPFSG